MVRKSKCSRLFNFDYIWNYVLIISDIDECESSPCKNKATCKEQVNGYSCTCPPSYTGTHCETGIYIYIIWLS